MRKLIAGLVVGASMLVAAPARAAEEAPAWGLRQTHVTDAWAVTHGSSRVTVAVIDTGVSALPDLAGRLLPGKDFVNHDDDASDDNGHGTMAATVIAAAGGNRTGIAGVCWSCRILPVKVLDAKGGGSYSDIALGIRWAADRGAGVISLSLGGSDDSPILRDAVAYADSKGALVVAAAGNRGVSTPHYPAAIPTVLAVGGVTDTGARYDWSNYGDWVGVTGPGCNPAQGPSGVVGPYCGTSSATPFVAGVAGLLASTSPAPTAAQIRAALIATKSQASGRVDALAALKRFVKIAPPDRTAPVLRLVKAKRYVTARATDPSGIARLELVVNGRVTARSVAATHRFALPRKARTVVVRAVDRAGNVRVANGKLGR
ncbi:S8 family serine peptidase [Actinoplanes bogorensis]|uniref:S8 family serine peptidase n=1 Tax=Paractinoplanes bogorensis TaxID=1610840 RepID=A0ABS5YZ63_9ACTN|nr:S8 family serine peptidase [Actinoplanes bogorensis]MBU2668728.1 S8 family serine peptidase [Actinoplanes bogorensis]